MRRITSDISIKVLSQTWSLPTLNEAQYLELDPQCYMLVREVHILGDENIWMYARTVMPHTMFQGKYAYILRELDHRPIGDLLYKQPGGVRQALQIAQLATADQEYQQATARHCSMPKNLWARRAQFRLFKSCFIVSEVLFPEIPSYVP